MRHNASASQPSCRLLTIKNLTPFAFSSSKKILKMRSKLIGYYDITDSLP
jgi:hypothetical protein